jgi:hypothetical protein
MIELNEEADKAKVESSESCDGAAAHKRSPGLVLGTQQRPCVNSNLVAVAGGHVSNRAEPSSPSTNTKVKTGGEIGCRRQYIKQNKNITISNILLVKDDAIVVTVTVNVLHSSILT